MNRIQKLSKGKSLLGKYNFLPLIYQQLIKPAMSLVMISMAMVIQLGLVFHEKNALFYPRQLDINRGLPG